MEKLRNPYDKECMKMAILKHEETFKQQVYELHRLYQVQKILMKNMEINKSKQEAVCKTKNVINNHNVNIGEGFTGVVNDNDRCNVKLDLDRRRTDAGGGLNMEIIDESEIELTLGPSCYGSTRKKKKKINSPETPGNSDSGGRSLSSSSTGSSNNRVNGTSRVDLEEQMRQERLMKQQPWLYQVLSLNIS